MLSEAEVNETDSDEYVPLTPSKVRRMTRSQLADAEARLTGLIRECGGRGEKALQYSHDLRLVRREYRGE